MSDSETDPAPAPRATVAFSLPQRRKNAFVSRMRTAAGNKAIVVKISGCQVLSVKSLVSSADSAQEGSGAGGGAREAIITLRCRRTGRSSRRCSSTC